MKFLVIAFYHFYLFFSSFTWLSRADKHQKKDEELSSSMLKGEGYQIFKPASIFEEDKTSKIVLSPEHWIRNLEETYKYLDQVSTQSVKGRALSPVRQRAIETYLQVLVGLLTGSSYGEAERSVRFDSTVLPYNHSVREAGEDMSYLGLTMVGRNRLDNVYRLLRAVVEDKIPGDFVETGVWRGGASIFAAAVLKVLKQSKRHVILCDSFQGWPEGSASLHSGDVGWNHITYAAVPDHIVARNFQQFGLLSDHVIFAKGFFNVSLPVLAEKVVKKIAVLRLDGDLYSSTADVLYNLYERVSVGGYVIVDDWKGFPAKEAVEDFFAVHKISATVIPIDAMSVYWKKEVEVTVEKERLKKKQFRRSASTSS